MRVFDFTHAIVRQPGRSVVQGLRENREASPARRTSHPVIYFLTASSSAMRMKRW
jgi:hypothetical protein